jgi:hypothetical protein
MSRRRKLEATNLPTKQKIRQARHVEEQITMMKGQNNITSKRATKSFAFDYTFIRNKKVQQIELVRLHFLQPKEQTDLL